MDPRTEPLTPAERDWITQQHEGARLFVETFSPADGANPVSLGALDRAFTAWLATGETDPPQINSAINCVGAVFGQKLVDELPLEWVIATDEMGTELAVYGLPGTGDVLIYPANFVAKRWERRESGFLETSFQEMVDQVRAIDNSAPSERKPWWKVW